MLRDAAVGRLDVRMEGAGSIAEVVVKGMTDQHLLTSAIIVQHLILYLFLTTNKG